MTKTRQFSALIVLHFALIGCAQQPSDSADPSPPPVMSQEADEQPATSAPEANDAREGDVPVEVNLKDGDFRIEPVRDIEELRREALAASPPDEVGSFRTSELAELTDLDPTIRLDVRYATDNNFMGSRMYEEGRAFLQRPAAEALVRVHRALGQNGLGLIIYDGYRPWYVTKMFWEATPAHQRTFVANPTSGSRHNRGCAVDLGVFDRATGAVLPMPSGYDEFSDRAYSNYAGGTEEQNHNRSLLREAMESEGFIVNPTEWWHFDYEDWRDYRIQNKRFSELD